MVIYAKPMAITKCARKVLMCRVVNQSAVFLSD